MVFDDAMNAVIDYAYDIKNRLNSAKLDKDIVHYNSILNITDNICEFITDVYTMIDNATVLDVNFSNYYVAILVGSVSEEVEEITYDNVERLTSILFFYTLDDDLADENKRHAYDLLSYRLSNGRKIITLPEELSMLLSYPRLYKEYIRAIAPNFIIGPKVLANLIETNKDWYNEFFGMDNAYDTMKDIEKTAFENDIRFNIQNSTSQDNAFIKECLLELADKLGVDLNERNDTQES